MIGTTTRHRPLRQTKLLLSSSSTKQVKLTRRVLGECGECRESFWWVSALGDEAAEKSCEVVGH
jgi:hypothetical protein